LSTGTGSAGSALSDTLRFLRLLWQAGEVRELRVPKHDIYNRTASGYFDTPEALAAAADRFDGHANVFFTLNPVQSALLARANKGLETLDFEERITALEAKLSEGRG
jgi:hypothetical protein